MGTLLDLIVPKPLEIAGLTPEDNREIALRRREALMATGRLELDDSAMHLLAQTFIAKLGEFPLDAVDAFYALRDELAASTPDTEIIDALAAAASRTGGDVEAIDILELARELRITDDAMSHYSITDNAGHTYRWSPESWGDDENAPGWDGELWEADYDE